MSALNVKLFSMGKTVWSSRFVLWIREARALYVRICQILRSQVKVFPLMAFSQPVDRMKGRSSMLPLRRVGLYAIPRWIWTLARVFKRSVMGGSYYSSLFQIFSSFVTKPSGIIKELADFVNFCRVPRRAETWCTSLSLRALLLLEQGPQWLTNLSFICASRFSTHRQRSQSCRHPTPTFVDLLSPSCYCFSMDFQVARQIFIFVILSYPTISCFVSFRAYILDQGEPWPSGQHPWFSSVLPISSCHSPRWLRSQPRLSSLCLQHFLCTTLFPLSYRSPRPFSRDNILNDVIFTRKASSLWIAQYLSFRDCKSSLFQHAFAY